MTSGAGGTLQGGPSPAGRAPLPHRSIRRWRRIAGVLGVWVAVTALLALGEPAGRWNHLVAAAIFGVAGVALINRRARDGWVALLAGIFLAAVGLGWPRHAGGPVVWINFTAGVTPALAVLAASLAGDVPWIAPVNAGR